MAPTTTPTRPRRARTSASRPGTAATTSPSRRAARPPSDAPTPSACSPAGATDRPAALAGGAADHSAAVAGDAAVVARPAPPLDPPCEEAVVRRPSQPTGGMDFLPGDWVAFPTRAAPASARQAPAPPSAGTPALSPPHPSAQRFVGMCVEILNGYRPASHLRQVTHPKHCTAITDQLIRRTVRVRMTPSHAARQGHLVRVRRMLVTEPLPGIAELVAILEQGSATWAMAVRLERMPHRTTGHPTWLCTLVQVV
ncbi:Rv3235 family protein [Dactylosporangium sp. CA-152071]|uniref:Rv3235 family protein n=1 Tax=Dactylosporangium sp. CA-152071 TaxID=3239933 RepID=UPI003D8F0F7E